MVHDTCGWRVLSHQKKVNIGCKRLWFTTVVNDCWGRLTSYTMSLWIIGSKFGDDRNTVVWLVGWLAHRFVWAGCFPFSGRYWDAWQNFRMLDHALHRRILIMNCCQTSQWRLFSAHLSNDVEENVYSGACAQIHWTWMKMDHLNFGSSFWDLMHPDGLWSVSHLRNFRIGWTCRQSQLVNFCRRLEEESHPVNGSHGSVL